MADSDKPQKPEDSPDATRGVSRRGFLATGVSALAGVTAVAAAVSPLRNLDPDDLPTLQEFFQKHYREMTPADKKRVFDRIRKEVEQRHKVQPNLSDPPPLETDRASRPRRG